MTAKTSPFPARTPALKAAAVGLVASLGLALASSAEAAFYTGEARLALLIDDVTNLAGGDDAALAITGGTTGTRFTELPPSGTGASGFAQYSAFPGGTGTLFPGSLLTLIATAEGSSESDTVRSSAEVSGTVTFINPTADTFEITLFTSYSAAVTAALEYAGDSANAYSLVNAIQDTVTIFAADLVANPPAPGDAPASVSQTPFTLTILPNSSSVLTLLAATGGEAASVVPLPPVAILFASALATLGLAHTARRRTLAA